jgi:hypothetical protein
MFVWRKDSNRDHTALRAIPVSPPHQNWVARFLSQVPPWGLVYMPALSFTTCRPLFGVNDVIDAAGVLHVALTAGALYRIC